MNVDDINNLLSDAAHWVAKSENDNVTVAQTIRDTLAEAQGGLGVTALDVEPRVYDAASDALVPGLHILAGPASSGKTVNCRALQIKQLRMGVPCQYGNVLEPRGAWFRPAAATVGVEDVKTKATHDDAADIEMAYHTWLEARLLGLSRTVAPGGYYPVLFVDSITYSLRSLLSESELKLYASATFKGGFSAADAIGALAHSHLAAKYRVALVGVINSELFPVAETLRGAAEALLTSVAPGTYFEVGRQSGRVRRAYELDRQDVALSFAATYGSTLAPSHANENEI